MFDDITLVLDGSGQSLIAAALSTLEIYGAISGLLVNTDKTQIVWIGKRNDTQRKNKNRETSNSGK